MDGDLRSIWKDRSITRERNGELQLKGVKARRLSKNGSKMRRDMGASR
jgi:hypothetical protein